MIKGIFWYFIAITLILALLDERVYTRGAFPVTAGWIGAFVLYYGLRSSWKCAVCERPPWRWANRRWWRLLRKSERHAPLVLDLVVISVLNMLTGGWASPLYMLYLGWAVALISEVSALSRIYLTAIAAVLFALGCLLMLHLPPLPLQIIIITEHLSLLLVASCGVGMLGMYIQRLKYTWEMERQQWESLRAALFAQLSHELYTPLSAMSASAALLLTPGAALPAEQQRRLAQTIERNCTRMGVLIDDLLAMWRKQRQQPEIAPGPLRCLAVAESIAQALSPLLEARQQRLMIQAEQPDAVALADERRLEQVLMNLVANAQKYAPAGTTITLTMSAPPDVVLFALHDEGAGVPFEEQGHLFDLLYRGTNCPTSSRGSGIGLALAQTLVNEEGGHIWVESAPGRGTTFYFTLPAARVE
ncbi:MAG TPA: HAMP domain-containing sensor histidine kinase [Ktedonobacterales bacterium]|nr:HAMP domain-containing sensor histidine kinase [Ktedonobacterales bacterium]